MCQQGIEKSVKSLSLALDQEPALTHHFTGLIENLVRQPKLMKYSGGIRKELGRTFVSSTRSVARELRDLVPKGTLGSAGSAARNTEYPFVEQQKWIAPSDIAAFNDRDIDSLLREAGRVIEAVTRIRATVYRRLDLET